MSPGAEAVMAKRNDVSVKMDAKVAEDCRIAAAFEGKSISEYISETMRAACRKSIEAGYSKRVAEEQAAPPAPEKPKKGKPSK